MQHHQGLLLQQQQLHGCFMPLLLTQQPRRASSCRHHQQQQQQHHHAAPSAAVVPRHHPSRGRSGSSTCCAASGRRKGPQEGPVIDKDYQLPQVGWMWDTSSSSSGGSGGSSSSSGGQPPKAHTTARSLQSANIKAKKSLGQNFCTDDAILANIVAAARVAPADAVIEVGPGTGNLTRHLLAAQAQVLAVEKDDVLFQRLGQEFEQEPNLRLVHGDVMRLDLRQLVQTVTEAAAAAAAAADAAPQPGASSSSSSSGEDPQQQQPKQPRRRAKVVANLPYNITKEFLVALLPQGELISELSIMIQEEVAQRLVDPTPSRPNYRAMNVYTQYYSKPVYRFRIPKEKYHPVPGVDGALVTFKLLAPGQRRPVPGERGFLRTVKQAFSERRKMLRNTLQPAYTAAQVEAALAGCGLRPDARAQELSTDEFAALYRALHAAVTAQLQT